MVLCVTGSVRGLAVAKVGILAVCNSATRDAGTGINSTPELLPLVLARKRHRVKLHKSCGLRFLFDCHKLNGLGCGLYDLIKGDVGLLIAPLAHKDVANFHFFPPAGFSSGVEPAFLQEAPGGFHSVKEPLSFQPKRLKTPKKEGENPGKWVRFRDRMT